MKIIDREINSPKELDELLKEILFSPEELIIVNPKYSLAT